jgi:predicted ATPase
MARIEGFRVQNYRVLKDVTLGKLWSTQRAAPLTPLVAVIGKNGSGKSTLIEAFHFLTDCLEFGVEEACDAAMPGGFDKLRSSGATVPLQFEVHYRETRDSRPITYELAIDADESGRPFVSSERLRQRRQGATRGRPLSFLDLEAGKGVVWKGESLPNPGGDVAEESAETEPIDLTDLRRLGIATLGALREHPRITRFCDFIQSWYRADFTPDAVRSLPLAGPQKHLDIHGDNLGNVVQYMEREFRDQFQSVLDRVAERIPGIRSVHAEPSADGRVLLQFNERGFADPFYAQQMSDGTLKLFAYLLLLQDPDPLPLICIEEPENGLYHKLLETLAAELREHATRQGNRSQVFVTTHQPYFVDALTPEETWVLEKGEDGFAQIRHASDDPLVKAMVDEGRPLGSLWYSDYLDAG